MSKKNKADYPIDFVLLWVDDSDPEWRKLRKQYSPDSDFLVDDSEARYRDWETLKYWFRGVEKFAPWVNKIYFVTCGHVPSWLNLDAEKLVHVKHEDYIPKEYLPTFSSSAGRSPGSCSTGTASLCIRQGCMRSARERSARSCPTSISTPWK